MIDAKCPQCGSPAPHLHPAVQVEGEVETCIHDFHLTQTNQNAAAYIASVHAKRARIASEWSTKAAGRGLMAGALEEPF